VGVRGTLAILMWIGRLSVRTIYAGRCSVSCLSPSKNTWQKKLALVFRSLVLGGGVHAHGPVGAPLALDLEAFSEPARSTRWSLPLTRSRASSLGPGRRARGRGTPSGIGERFGCGGGMVDPLGGWLRYEWRGSKALNETRRGETFGMLRANPARGVQLAGFFGGFWSFIA